MLNRITDDERQQILNNLNAAAHDAAEKSSLKSDAEEQVAQRLKDLIHHNDQPMKIEWTDSMSKKPIQIP
jgi:excinuclease UvrABC nuclease subunit